MIRNVENETNKMCNIDIIENVNRNKKEKGDNGLKNNIKSNKAITLIALVITIIIILILARSKYCNFNR